MGLQMARQINKDVSRQIGEILGGINLDRASREPDAQAVLSTFITSVAALLGTESMRAVVECKAENKKDAIERLSDILPLPKAQIGDLVVAVEQGIRMLGSLKAKSRKWATARRDMPTTPAQRLAKLRIETVTGVAKKTFRYGAAGGTTFRVTLGGEPGYRVVMSENWDTYRGSFRGWKANEDHHKITVPADWRRSVYARDLERIDGTMTLSATLIETVGEVEIYKAIWAKQGRGYSVSTEHGVIVKAGKKLFHAKSVEAAKKLIARL